MNVSPEGRLSLEHVKYVEVSDPPLLRAGDILFNNTNSPVWVGKTTCIRHDEQVTYSNHMTRIRIKERAGLPTFYAWQLHSLQQSGYFLARCKNHVNQASISTKYLSDMVQLRVAPANEQRRIVEVIEAQFSRLYAGMAALEQVRINLKRYRTAVLKAAVEGRLTEALREENPDAEPASELLARILKERRKRWEKDQLAAYEKKGKKPPKNWQSKYREPPGPDTENLPELPEDWNWVSVEQLADVGTGATPLRGRPDYYENGTIPWVTSGALNRLLVTKAREYITAKALSETNVKIFPSGSLLIAMYGEGKTRGKVAELGIDAATNQACAALIFDSTSMTSQPYVKQFMLSRYLEIRRSSAGGVQPNLNLSIVRRTPVALPPLEEQGQIVAEIERRLSILQEVEAEVEANLKHAARLRQSILKRAFEGKLVPQDPTDEPVSELLARIRAERERSGPRRRRKKGPARDEPAEAQAGLF
jgi:type I restriction enzyme, S subunit